MAKATGYRVTSSIGPAHQIDTLTPWRAATEYANRVKPDASFVATLEKDGGTCTVFVFAERDGETIRYWSGMARETESRR